MKNKRAGMQFGLVPLTLVIIIIFFFGGIIVVGILEDYKNSNQKVIDEKTTGQKTTTPINESQDSKLSKEGVKEITERADKIAEQPIEIPEKYKLRDIAKILFKIDSPAPLNLLMITGILFIIFYALFADIFEAFSPFSTGVATMLGICITLIVSIIGITKSVSLFLLDVGSGVAFLEKNNILNIFFIIIILIILLLLITKTTKWAKTKKEKQKSEEAGTELGIAAATMKAVLRPFAWIGSKLGKKDASRDSTLWAD